MNRTAYSIDPVAVSTVCGRLEGLSPDKLKKATKVLRIIQAAKYLGAWGLNPNELETICRWAERNTLKHSRKDIILSLWQGLISLFRIKRRSSASP